MQLEAQHYHAIADAMADIRTLCTDAAPGDLALEGIRQRLVQLAGRTDLFNAQTLPSPGPNEQAANFLYRLYEEDEGLALYANAASGRLVETPAHNHKTWAVIAGVQGCELNRLFVRTSDGGVRETQQLEVRQGTSLVLGSEDLHAIRIEAPVLNFHLYGVGMERQSSRQLYDPGKNQWVHFKARTGIVEARQGHAN